MENNSHPFSVHFHFHQNHQVTTRSSSTLHKDSISIYNHTIPWYFPLTSNRLHSTASLYSLLRHPEQYPKVLLPQQQLLIYQTHPVDFHSSFPGTDLPNAKRTCFISSIGTGSIIDFVTFSRNVSESFSNNNDHHNNDLL